MFKKKNYISVRVKKIRTATDAQNAARHGARAKGSFKTSAVDLERSHLNGHWRFDPDGVDFVEVGDCPDYWDELEKCRKGMKAKGRKNGAVGSEMMFTASPAFFKDRSGAIDDDKARKWAKACLTLAKERYGAKCVAARLDMDETTPHLSVFILPTYEKSYAGQKRKSTRAPRRTVSHNKVFGGPDDHRLLQDWAADGLQLQGFNLHRGIPVEISRAKHFRPDGAVYNAVAKVWRRLAEREKKVELENKKSAGWLRQVAEVLEPHRHLLPPNLLGGMDKLAGRLEQPREPLQPVDDQITRQVASSSDRRSPEPDAQDQPAPAPKPPGM